MFGLYSHFLKLWDHRNQHIGFEEVIILEEERKGPTLDEILAQAFQECADAKKKPTATESGTEQFSEMVEKYHRPNFDDEER